MILDLFFRAETPAAYIEWLTAPPARAIIGDLRTTVNGQPALRSLDDVLVYEIPRTFVVLTPNVLDAEGEVIVEKTIDHQAWVHLRLIGDAASADFAGFSGDLTTDRWKRSRMVKLVSAGNGKAGSHRGVSTFTKSVGGKDVAVFRGSEMHDAGVASHEYAGGSRY